MQTKDNPADLVKLALDNPERFADLYNQFFDKIYRYVFFRVSHKETAEDLTEEVFIKAYESLPLLKNPKTFSAWLYQIAKNLIIDYYRKTKNIIVDDLANIPAEKLVEYDILDETQVTLIRLIEKLPLEQQQVIKMRYLEELPYEVLSKSLGKSEVNIRVIQHRAIKKLKSLKEDEL